MPWTNVTYMEEINRFVILARSGRFTVTELCEQFGISRKTGYKHLAARWWLLDGVFARHHRLQFLRAPRAMQPALRENECLDRFVGALRRVVRLVAARLQAHQTECGVAVYPRDQEVKVISSSGHLAHEGRNYHVGDAFAGKRVGLRLNSAGRTELHFANVHLGHLAYDAEGGRFTPAAYVAPLRLPPAPLKRPPAAAGMAGREQAPSPEPLP